MSRTPGSGRKRKWCKIHPDRPSKSHGRCEQCYRKTRREKATFKTRVYRYRKVYGITMLEYEAMFAAQGGRCAICLTDEAKVGTNHPLYVDHDHSAGKVRGLLCHRCNIILGRMQDDPLLFRRAAQYLEIAP